MLNRTRFLQTLLIILLAINAPIPAHGQTPGSGTTSAHIRVGIYNNYPLIYEKAGIPTGFQLELLKEVAQEEGWTLDYQFSGSLKNVLQGLEAGTLDLGLGIVPTEGRRQFLDFTDEQNALLTGQIFVMPGRSDIDDISALEGKTVAFINQGVIGDNFVETCDKLKIAPVYTRVNSYGELAEAVATGAVDAGLFNELQGHQFAELYKIQPTGIVFKSYEAQYAVPKGKNTSVIATLDRYMHTWKTIENSTYHQLDKEFLQEGSAKSPEWTSRQLLLAISSCLLLLIFAVILGNFLSGESQNSYARISKDYVRHIIIFVAAISLSFWVMDSLVAWLLFNNDLQMSLLQWTITKVPPENLYIRGMLFLVCCVFGIYLVKYIHRYEELLNVLVMSLKRFEQLTDNARDMLYRMSLPSGRYEFVSKASSEIFGYSPEEFYRRPLLIKQMVHQDWQDDFSRQWEELLSGKVPPYYEYRIVTKSGESRWVNQRNTVYYNESGTPVAIEGIVTDITELKKAAATKAQALASAS